GGPLPGEGGGRRKPYPGRPQRSRPQTRFWGQSESRDHEGSECRVVARLPHSASKSSPAAPDRADTSSRPVPRAGLQATSPNPLLRSPRRLFRRLPALPHWRGPAHRHGAGCLPGKSCRRAGAERRLGLRLTIQLSLKALDRHRCCQAHRQSPSPHHLRKRTRSQGPLLNWHCPASTLVRPCPTPARTAACRDVEVATLAHDGSPSITRTTFPTCRAHYPGGSSRCMRRLLPRSRGLPQMAGGSASALSLSRPAQASLALRPAGSLSHLKRPSSRGSSPASYPAKLLVSFRINRQLSGWNLPPLMIRAFEAHCHERTSEMVRPGSMNELGTSSAEIIHRLHFVSTELADEA